MVIITFIIYLSLYKFGHFACFTEEHFKLHLMKLMYNFYCMVFKVLKLPFICLVSGKNCLTDMQGCWSKV